MPEKWSKKNQTSAGGRKYRFCTPIRCTKSTWWWIFPTPLICVCKSKIAVAQPTKKIFLCLSKNLSEKFWSNISKIERQNFFSAVDNQFFRKRIENFSNFVSKFALTGERQWFQKNHLWFLKGCGDFTNKRFCADIVRTKSVLATSYGGLIFSPSHDMIFFICFS